MKNLLEIFTKVLDNESLIEENKLPTFILDESQVEILKIYSNKIKNESTNEFDTDKFNSAKYMLMSDGKCKHIIWKYFISLLNCDTFENKVFGCAIKEKNTIQNWLLKRIAKEKGSIKLFEQGKKTIIIEGVWHCYTFEGSLKEVDYWIDFGDFNTPPFEKFTTNKINYINLKTL